MMASQCAGSFTAFGQGCEPSWMPLGTLGVGVAPLEPPVEEVVVGGSTTGELLLLQAVSSRANRASTAIAINVRDLWCSYVKAAGRPQGSPPLVIPTPAPTVNAPGFSSVVI